MNRSSRHSLSALLAVIGLLGISLHAVAQDTASAAAEIPLAHTAEDSVPYGILNFSIRNDRGEPIPGRLTFVGSGPPGTNLFPNHAAAPQELAMRKDLIYSLSGIGRITVPVGNYRVFASRGLEWSLDQTDLEIKPEVEASFEAVLRPEIDTKGWVSADFHLHTLTYSGHGDANLEERMISILGEGLEVAVATDHNHHTDFTPTLAQLGATGQVLPIVGNEISTPLGHFNSFPLNPSGPIFPPNLRDGPALFGMVKAHQSGVGVTPVIQVNHPRWTGIDYFTKVQLDPLSGEAKSRRYSPDFDSIEILNENAGWGYYETADAPVATGKSRESVLEDWFNLLDRGLRVAAVGNSDSHSVRAQIAGFPRNFVRSSTDLPAEVSIEEVATAVREKLCFTTTGPFVEVLVNNAPTGSEVRARDAEVELHVKIQAASWIDVDRVIVVINGDRQQIHPVDQVRNRIRFDQILQIPLIEDSWLVVLVEGDDSLAPIVPDKERPILPIAITNPIWIDADGVNGWKPPLQTAQELVSGETTLETGGELLTRWNSLTGATRKRWLISIDPSHPAATELAQRGLTDSHRRTRLAACSLIDRLNQSQFDRELVTLITDRAHDADLRARALQAISEKAVRSDQLLRWLSREGPADLAGAGEWVNHDLPGDFIRKWRVVGYFPVSPDPDSNAVSGASPEEDGSLDRRFLGKGGERGWEVRETRRSGYLDLLGLVDDPLLSENAFAYAEVWLHSDREQEIPFTVGTDDGCVLFLGSQQIYVDTGTHGADPLAHFGQLPLVTGWNRLLMRVENGRGGFGAYLRLLDPTIEAQFLPRETH